MKPWLSAGATLLIVAAYAPYIRDILKGKTRPHVYTWCVSGLVTMIACGLQLSGGAGWGSAPTFAAAAAGLGVFVLSLGRARAAITRSDTLFFAMALVATGLWLLTDQPVASVMVVSLVEILAFVPTLRKSWDRPDQETFSAYAVNTLRFALSTVAVQHYSVVTVLYPLSATLTGVLICVYLLVRRRALRHRRGPFPGETLTV